MYSGHDKGPSLRVCCWEVSILQRLSVYFGRRDTLYWSHETTFSELHWLYGVYTGKKGKREAISKDKMQFSHFIQQQTRRRDRRAFARQRLLSNVGAQSGQILVSVMQNI